MAEFMTIRSAVRNNPNLISETELRRRVRAGRCPGVYHGTRFMVNIPLLREQLDIESRRNCSEVTAE